MTNTYFDLIDQTFDFPQEGFDIDKGYLVFNGVPLIHLIRKYGTPLKLTYLPKISSQIKKSKNMFTRAMKGLGYQGKYRFCYCTKSSHFSYILNEVLSNHTEIETSSEFDIHLVNRLLQEGKLNQDTYIICNGFKPLNYLNQIVTLIKNGQRNCIPICDNPGEIDYYSTHLPKGSRIGLRMATEEEPNFEFYTSRLGIRNTKMVQIYTDFIKPKQNIELYMLHFFVDTGIRDSLYYWGELKKAVKLYCDLKKVCPTLSAINIGGGMPIRNSLSFEFDYKYMVREIVKIILDACQEEGIPEPDIFTEFGKYTVGESGAVLYSVLDKKQQNDSECWYMIDSSLMTTLPDTWGIGQRFILLPVNYWKNEYQRVNIGGLSCDNADYYNSEAHESKVFLPKIDHQQGEALFLGFFHTGAYQDAISGYGGIKHCLIPAPQHVILYRNDEGNLVDQLYKQEQSAEEMLKILGY